MDEQYFVHLVTKSRSASAMLRAQLVVWAPESAESGDAGIYISRHSLSAVNLNSANETVLIVFVFFILFFSFTDLCSDVIIVML